VGKVVAPHKKNNRTTREEHCTYAKKIVTQTQERQQHQHKQVVSWFWRFQPNKQKKKTILFHK